MGRLWGGRASVSPWAGATTAVVLRLIPFSTVVLPMLAPWVIILGPWDRFHRGGCDRSDRRGYRRGGLGSRRYWWYQPCGRHGRDGCRSGAWKGLSGGDGHAVTRFLSACVEGGAQPVARGVIPGRARGGAWRTSGRVPASSSGANRPGFLPSPIQVLCGPTLQPLSCFAAEYFQYESPYDVRPVCIGARHFDAWREGGASAPPSAGPVKG